MRPEQRGQAAAVLGRQRPLPLGIGQHVLEQLRRQHLAVLEGLDGPGWERTGRHGEHGEVTIELYATHVAAEEVDHLAQIARLL
jgi:hypothetical protein